MKGGMFRAVLLMMPVALVSVFSCTKEKSYEGGGVELRSKEYPLNAVGASGVNGQIVISENADSTFNVLVTLSKTVKDTVHVLHIHNGSTTSPGSIAVQLSPVTGTGDSATSLTSNIGEITLPDHSTQKATYDDMMGFAGYVDVHYSQAKSDSLIAEGAIGL
jgi:hypothetical protein